MKIGVITTGTDKYALILIQFLTSRSLRPDHVIIIRHSPVKRILRNLKLSRLVTLISIRNQNAKSHNKYRTNDYLEQFLKTENILPVSETFYRFLQKEKIPYVVAGSTNSRRTVDFLREAETDVLINAGAGIFRDSVISSVKQGILNAHMGFLPDFRGMNVLEWSLFCDRSVGVTLHYINHGIDTGDILLFKEIPVTKGDTIEGLRAKSAVINMKLFLEGIEGIESGALVGNKQSADKGKQYFVMHPRLKMIAEERLQKRLSEL